MAEVKIKITTEADLAGVRSTEEALKRLEQKTGKSAAESAAVFTADAKSKQDSADMAQALSDITRESKQLGAEQADLTKKTGFLSASKKDLIGSLKALKHEIPGLGLAIHALKNPYVAIAAAIAAFISKVNQQIEVQKELARQGASLAAALDPSIVKLITTSTQSAKAAEEMRKFGEEMKTAADQANSLDAALSKQLGKVDREERQQQAELELQKQKSLLGVTDPVERARIDADFAARSRQAKQDADERKVALQAEADRKARQAADDAKHRFPAEAEKLAAMESQAAERAKMRETLTGDLSGLQEELGKSFNQPSAEEQRLYAATWGLLGSKGEKGVRSSDVIQEEIRQKQRMMDRNRAEEIISSGEIDSQGRIVRGLASAAVGGTRFSGAVSEGNAAAMSGRRIVELQNQTGQTQIDSALAEQLEKATKENENLTKAFLKYVEKQRGEVMKIHGVVEENNRR